jgi:hypothetical protein
MTSPWGRVAALWSTVAGWGRVWLTRARASRNYGRAKRLAWDVLVGVATATLTTLLTWLLHGR